MTIEEMNAKYGKPVVSVNKPTRSRIEEALGAVQPPETFASKAKPILEGAASFTGGKQLAQGLGQTIANAGGAQTDSIEAQDRNRDIQTSLIKTIHENRTSGKDTTKLMGALSELGASQVVSGETTEDLGTGGLSDREVIGSAVQLAGNLIPGAGKGASLSEKAVRGGLQGYAFDVGNKLQDEDKTYGEAFKPGLGTAVGYGIPFASALLGSLAKHSSGFTSGTGSEVIQRSVDNPKVIGEAVEKYAKTPEAKQTLVDKAKAAISSFVQDKQQEYGSNLSKLGGESAGKITKSAASDSFAENIAKFGGKISEKGNVSFSNSTLTKTDQNALKQVWSTMQGWTDETPQGLDALRQAIKNHMEDFSITKNDRANVVLGKVVDDLKGHLSKNLPGYSDMLSSYASKSQLTKDIVKELQIGGAAKASTQLNNVMRIFQKDPEVRNKLVTIMGEKGADDFLNELSGAILSDWLPRGSANSLIGRTATEVGAAGTAALAGGVLGAGIPAALTGAAMASPRIVGTVARTAGRLKDSVISEGVKRATTMASSKEGQ